jgi:hypothetical protein
MGGKGGKPQPVNDQIVQMQQQQAAQAREANIERNARLQYGTQQISDIFQGHPAGLQPVDLSSLANAPAPTNTPTQVGNQVWDDTQKAWVAGGAGTSGALAGGYSYRAMPDSGGVPQYGLYDSSGGLVTTANSVADLAKARVYSGTGTPGAGMTGGFDPAFYDKFRQSQLDYYLPQEGQQYTAARSDLAYNLARAGQLNSSNAATDIAKLSQQDVLNQAQIASQADTQTAGLRNTIQQDQQTALNQLYSTEDPTVAANTAQNMVASANLTKPILNPVGALFAPITAGVGTALTGFTNPYAYLSSQGAPTAATPAGNQAGGQNVKGY